MLKRLLIFSGYAAVAAFVIIGTLSLVAYGRGFSYDLKSGKLVQRGLVLISTEPSGARITMDGKALRKDTPYRANIRPGEYDYVVERDGRVAWRKQLVVEPGEVTNAQYVILVPTELKRSTLASEAQIGANAISRDHKRIAYAASGPAAGVYVIDLPEGRPINVFAPPLPQAPTAASPALPAETVQSLDWSADGSHLLIVTDRGGQKIHRVMAADGSDIINLTETFRLDLSGLQFGPRDWRQMYWVSPEGLRQVDIGARTVSAVLAPDVSAFAFGGDRIFYISSSPLGRSLSSFPLGNPERKEELVQSIGESEGYSLSYGSFRGEEMIAVVPSRSRTATVYTELFEGKPLASVVARDVDRAEFTGDGRFLALSGRERTLVYDVEHSAPDEPRVYSRENGPDFAGLTWFDPFHLLVTEGGKVKFMDFDGSNVVELGDASAGTLAYSTTAGRRVVYFSPAENGTSLRQVIVRP